MLSPITTLLTALLPLTHALSLDTTSPSSIRSASAALAHNLMSYYQTNTSGTSPENIGTLPPPLYWWQAGAMWGGLVDYWAYTNDPSYNPTITQALQAQVGPDNNYMPPAYFSSLGNDDQAFWALAVLSAVESGFPDPPAGEPQWLALAEAVFNTQWPRWGTETCGGGLKWQIFEANAGYYYKNTVSNGAFFQIAARLARYTGNQTYVEWAERAWDWMETIGLFDADYNVFDGTDEKINCSALDHTGWTYNPALLIHGTATMYNYTNGSAVWQERTSGLLHSTIRNFYRLPNATAILYEAACEPYNTCNNDQYSFKAYASRFLAKTAILAPYTLPAIRTLLTTSAEAVSSACSSGPDNATCGQRWYVGGFDGNAGIGQQMSALEGVQGLMAVLPQAREIPSSSLNATWTNGTAGGGGVVQQQQWVPRTGPDVTIAVVPVTSTFVAEGPTGTADGGAGQAGAGSAGQNGGDGDGEGDGESTGAVFQSRAELGVKAALPVIAAAAVEVGGFV
jgi:mannan endo-1,6-alpha-mannosidase